MDAQPLRSRGVGRSRELDDSAGHRSRQRGRAAAQEARCDHRSPCLISTPGLRFYRDLLGHPLRWRKDAIGQAGPGLLNSDAELVLTTEQRYEPDWLVASVDQAAARFEAAGWQSAGGADQRPCRAHGAGRRSRSAIEPVSRAAHDDVAAQDAYLDAVVGPERGVQSDLPVHHARWAA